MTKKIKLIILFFGYLGIFGLVNFAFAQDFGVSAVNNGLAGSLAVGDPREIVGRIIQILLSFLGAIAIVIIMYAGFIWMTSNGDEEKITQAKGILKNAVIGLIIILSSWAITTFILTRLAGAIDGTGTIDIPGGQSGNLVTSGAGAIGACSVESVYPTDGQTDLPRNTSIMITFKEALKLDSICVNAAGDACTCDSTSCNKINPLSIRLYKTELGDACTGSSCSNPNSNVTEVMVAVSGDKTLVLMPASLLGESSNNIGYSLKLTNRVKKAGGDSMFKGCSADYLEWGFTVSTRLDLNPPVVVPGAIFPRPDNIKDIFQQISPAQPARGLISVKDCLQIYSPAKLKSISPSGPEVVLSYHGATTQFIISIPAGSPNKAQLFDGHNRQTLLGAVDFNSNNEAVFENYLIFKTTDHPEGSSWTIAIEPEILADTLTVNSSIYTFAASSENNNIQVPAACDLNLQAANIAAKLSGQSDIMVDRSGSNVNLEAKTAGQVGNGLPLNTTDPLALLIKPLAGGSDRQVLNESRDEQDRPMNSVVQVNFNEPINPLTISGTASEVADYISIVNADPATVTALAGTICSSNSQCRSYKCENSVCVGDYLGGKFVVANGYKTVEFVSDVECGVNGCGETIYCLPANSHLAVEMVAANLKPCASDNDCLALNPFTACRPAVGLAYRTCQNPENKNYPSASPSGLDGVVDAAINSLDGNRSLFSDGPIDFFNENNQAGDNQDNKDKYKWSFYVNDQIMLTPPQISSVSPAQGQSNLSLADPIEIVFNTLMMNSSLRSGSQAIKNGTSTFTHKLVNLRSSTPSALGYWILSDNLDIAPLDGEPDLTKAKIFHTPFSESVTYSSQVGSGVKDIYQNCYKPSIGPGCSVSAAQPSCCFGNATAVLGADGNCQ